MKRKFPNLFIIGAPKCGTTSLAHWLSEHPQIYFYVGKGKDTKAEPHYWATDFDSYHKMDEKEYFEIFDNIDEKRYKYAGEASVCYLYSDTAIKNIEKNIYQPKYIVCIRNPVDMAYSLWLHQIREGIELITDSFLEAFRLSNERGKGNLIGVNSKLLKYIITCNNKRLNYKFVCSLGTQLEKLFKLVPEKRILVLILDDIKRDPKREWKNIVDFLKVEGNNRSSFPVLNRKKIPRNKILHKLYVEVMKFNAKTYGIRKKIGLVNLGLGEFLNRLAFTNHEEKRLTPEERKQLVEYFLPEIEKLENILGRKFDEWKK